MQLGLLKWTTNDMCEPITMLFNLVNGEGFPASWATNTLNSSDDQIRQKIFFGKLGLFWPNMSRIERDKGKRQTNFMEGRSTLDHILPLCTLLDQVIFSC